MYEYGRYIVDGYVRWVKAHPSNVHLNRRGFMVEYAVVFAFGDLTCIQETLGMDGLGLEW
jgi:hypothetical protein